MTTTAIVQEKRLCRYQNIMCEYATDMGCCKITGCAKAFSNLTDEFYGTTQVLDKIRAEITATVINGQIDEHTAFIRTGEQVKQMVLDVIDRYKAESEGKE